MSKLITIVCVGPALSVRGGVSRVIEMIKGHLPDHIRFHLVATVTRYTGGAETHHSDRGNRLVQALVFGRAVAQVLVYGLRRRAVFHVHFATKGSLLRKGLICIVLRTLRCRYVVHAHSSDIDLFPGWLPHSLRHTFLWGIRGAFRFIALSQLWYEQHSAMLDLSSSRLMVLPNPTEMPKSIPVRTAKQGLNILFLGRIGVNKGAFDVIRAFAVLPDDVRRRCHITLAGDGDVDAARELGAHLGCSAQMSVPGWLTAPEVDRVLGEADVLLLPSHAEGMAMALIEGMSWGLAVVATTVGAHGEFLESGSNSIVVTPGDVQGISNAICELARNPELRLRLGLGARETVSRFSIDLYIATLSRLYEKLANETQRECSGGANNHGLSADNN
jgi:glycosyltransferase involved in cell wall biosynthesis